MAPRKRALTGTRALTTSDKPKDELTFPAHLVHLPKSQVSQYGDAISDRIAQLDGAAQRMAEGFGIPMSTFVLNPIEVASANDNLAMLSATLQAFTHKEERISLERRNGRWGLYFTRGVALVGNDRTVETVPLRDAPLDVRERFLARSEDFFREYLSLCKDRLGRMKSSVGAANRTLELLANLRLE